MSIDYQFDRDHIWHPYTSLTKPVPVYGVKSATGVFIELDSGEQLIDGMGSWWSTIHGYSHPRIQQAMKDQIDQMSHVMFGGITHEPAVELCKKLVAITPEGLDRVFLSDSGSVSVEVAIKMAIQYWRSQGNFDKCKMLAPRGGYHGDTFGAMAVCDPINGMHSLFEGAKQQHLFCDKPQPAFDQPWQDSYLDSIKQTLQQDHTNIAAVILEPIVQGAGGMRMYHPEYLRQVKKLCDEFQVLLIADEIATGFGRTGKMFACEWADISPDIICVGKAITGGNMSLAATLTSKKIAHGICNGQAGVMMHGPTFMGNPLACAAANASISLLTEQDWQSKVQQIEAWLTESFQPLIEFKRVQDVRILGAIGVVELTERVDVASIQAHFVQQGVWIRPFGKLVYVMPPYISEQTHIIQIANAIRSWLALA